MFVVTADQRGSRRASDAVPEILESLDDILERGRGILLPFVRTVGDEIQGVLDDAQIVVEVAMHLQRRQEWSVGVGIGAGQLAESAPASSGPAFIAARAAVERSRSRTVPTPLAIEVADAGSAEMATDVEALAQLLAAVVRRRTEAQWRAVDLFAAGASGVEAARELEVTPQNVSRLRRDGLWDEERGARRLLARLLAGLESDATMSS